MVYPHKMKVQRTAFYYSVGLPGPHIKNFYIACHGYGQLAKKFIYKFESIDDGETLVIAPEGMSRFYWKRDQGQVGSSWMTKEDRLDEIADYTRYLKSIYDQYVRQLAPDVRIVLFGFSQGCATQVRWLLREQPHFHHLVLWGGLLPEDLDYLPFNDYLRSKQLYFVYGDEDEFLLPEYLEWHRSFARSQRLELEEKVFAGRHVVDRPTLLKLHEQISK